MASVPWSLLAKGTTEHDLNAKATTVGTTFMASVPCPLLRFGRVPWSLLPKGTTEAKP